MDVQPLPGLPLSALMAFAPACAAIALTWRSDGPDGVVRLMARTWDGRRASAVVWLAALLGPVMVAAVVWILLHATGDPAPAPRIPLWAPVVLFAAFYVGALGEELGWTAYALDPLQAGLGPLRAALLLGVIWAVWHLVPFVEAGRDWRWIAWHAASMPATRVIMLWVYRRGRGSVAVVASYHAADNTAAFLFPVWGSFYDPKLSAMALMALASGLVLADRRGFSLRR